MSHSDVRDIDSLDDLRSAITRLAERLQRHAQQSKASLGQAEQHFHSEYPAYWQTQLKLAEWKLTEAETQLSRKQSVVRPGDRRPATEEKKQVAQWKQRVRLCHDKVSLLRRVALEVEQAIEKTKGPVADLMELAEVQLPRAAERLGGLVDRLRDYQDKMQ